jgi:hypothetical protein
VIIDNGLVRHLYYGVEYIIFNNSSSVH